MSGLKTVYLHGILGEKYGFEHHFALSSPREVISALSANFPGFRADYHQFPFYGLICDGDNRHEDNCPDVASAPFSRDIHLVPMVEGRFAALFVPLLGYLGITGVAATVISSVLTVGLLFGVSLLLAPKPPDAEKRDQNYMFTGPENVTAQGAAVPLIYGRCFVGSVVISSGLEVARGAGEEEGEGKNYSWKSQGGEISHHSRDEDAAYASRRRAFIPDRPTIWRAVNG